jgi:hypothetical protein
VQDGGVPEEVTPRLARVLAVAIIVFSAGTTVLIGFLDSWTNAALALPWMALFALAGWATFWRPCVIVSDAGVRLVNVSRTIDVPWPALQGVEARWALTLVTAYGRFTAWGAPAPGAYSAFRAVGTRPHDPLVTGDLTVRPGELPDSPSGAAAELVQRRWAKLRAAGHLDQPRLERDRATVRWHIGTALAALALLALGLLTLA